MPAAPDSGSTENRAKHANQWGAAAGDRLIAADEDGNKALVAAKAAGIEVPIELRAGDRKIELIAGSIQAQRTASCERRYAAPDPTFSESSRADLVGLTVFAWAAGEDVRAQAEGRGTIG